MDIMVERPIKEANPAVSIVCSNCRKPLRNLRKGSITSWIFSSSSCTCGIEQEVPAGQSGENRFRDPTSDAADYGLGEQYEVLEYLGQGGMGTVLKVKEPLTDKVLAVKVLRSELSENVNAVRRFEQEAKTAATLTHPNLLQVYGQGKAATGAPFLVMEFIDGQGLDTILSSGAVNQQRALDILLQISDALVYAHTRKIIHRDLKPSNVLITSTAAGADHVYLADFGIAKVQSDIRSTQDLTGTGEVLGSPSYMSPEQCLGTAQDHRSDIYSLGCLMYELFTGEILFWDENPVQIIAKHLSQERPVKTSSRLPNSLANIIRMCISREPDKRYQSIEELQKDLLSVKEGKSPQYCQLTNRSILDFTEISRGIV